MRNYPYAGHLTADDLRDILMRLKAHFEKLVTDLQTEADGLGAYRSDHKMGKVSERGRGPLDQEAVFESAQIDLIKNALERIAENRYGTCPVCDRPIPIERLKEAPESPYCTACEKTGDR